MQTNQKDREEFSSGIHKAADDLRSGAYRASNEARDTVNNVKDDLQGIARQAGQRAREFADNAEHATDSLTSTIRENPMTSSLVAIGVGFLIGSLFRR